MELKFLLLSLIFFVYTNDFANSILRGVYAEIEDYPYQVSIKLHTNKTHSKWCGGSIYKRNVIITAAHCIENRKSTDVTVRAGSNNHENVEVLIRAKKLILHEGYSSFNVKNDIALIILSKNLEYSNKIQPIELAKEEPKTGEIARISGWGKLKVDDISGSKILQAIKILIWERKSCSELVNIRGFELTENMICAGLEGSGKNACKGDSGGPLIVNGKLAGITSWGWRCATRDLTPDVFTNVPKYLNWIDSSLKDY